MDLTKFFDVFKLTNKQLKVILGLSISLMIIIYPLGKEIGKYTNKINTIEKGMFEIKKTQRDIKSEIKYNVNLNKTTNTTLYNEILDIQNLDNDVDDNKFDLIIKYSIKNKSDRDNLYNFFDMIDDKRDADISRLHSNNSHKKDSLK